MLCYALCGVFVVEVVWKEVGGVAENHSTEVNTVHTPRLPVRLRHRASPQDLVLDHLIGADVILIHPLQLAVDLLLQLLRVGVGEETGHDGGRDDKVGAEVDPVDAVPVRRRTGSSPGSPGLVQDGSPPDGAGLGQGAGPEELVRLEPPGVEGGVVLVVLVALGEVVVELRDEAGHEEVDVVGQQVVTSVCLDNRIVAIPSRLTLRAHVLLEVFVCLRSRIGGEVSEVGHQVVLIERSEQQELDHFIAISVR